MKKAILILLTLLTLPLVFATTLNVSISPQFPLTTNNLVGTIETTDTGENITLATSWYKDGDLNMTTLLTNNLVAYYPFNNDTDDYYGDHISQNVGAVPIDGIIGNGYNFSGTQYIKSGMNTSLDPDVGFTISTWIKAGLQDNGEFISYWDVSSGGPMFVLRLENGGQTDFTYQFRTDSGESTNWIDPSMPSIIDNTWHHLVITRVKSDNSIKSYLDGQLIHSSSWNPSAVMTMDNDPGGLFFGVRSQDGVANQGFHFEGGLDEIMIFNNSLSGEQVRQLYRGTRDGGLLVYSNNTLPGEEWTLEATALTTTTQSASVNDSVEIVTEDVARIIQYWRNRETGENVMSIDSKGNLNVTGTLYAHNFSGNSPIVFLNSTGNEVVRINDSGLVNSHGYCIDGDCVVNWSTLSSNLWEVNGTELYYDSGNVEVRDNIFSLSNSSLQFNNGSNIAIMNFRDALLYFTINNNEILKLTNESLFVNGDIHAEGLFANFLNATDVNSDMVNSNAVDVENNITIGGYKLSTGGGGLVITLE